MSDTYTRRRARQMSDQELRLMLDAIVQEQAVRRRLDASPEKINRAISDYQQSMGREDGERWVQPTSALDSYPQGAVVTYDGERYRSTTAANVWQPPIGWRLVPETDDEGREIPPPYVPPTGSHDSYQAGERITWDGDIYEAVRDGVVHSPAEYAADWRLIEPEPEPEPEPEEPPEDEEPDPEEPTDPEEPEPGDGEGDEDDEPEPEPEPEPELPEWETGVDYQPGNRFTYGGAEYVVRQAHTSAAHWPPDAVPALYERQG